MMILSPEPIAAITAGAENLLTASPKEVWLAGAANPVVDIDLGVDRAVDTVFLGFTSAGPAVQWRIIAGAGGAGPELQPQQLATAADAISGRPHMLSLLAAPVMVRHIRLQLTAPAGLMAGVVMVGQRFVAAHERGSGRQLRDSSVKEDLPDGGFAIVEGVVRASLKWRFVGLSDAARRRLWSLAYRRGETRPVLVIEEPDSEAAGADERIHYGLFDRFDAYERADPNDNAWALSMTEWV